MKKSKGFDPIKYIGSKFKTKRGKALLKREFEKATVSLRIAELRKELGFSQKEFARRLHTKQQCVSRIEQPGNTKINLNTLYKIADVFHRDLIIKFV